MGGGRREGEAGVSWGRLGNRLPPSLFLSVQEVFGGLFQVRYSWGYVASAFGVVGTGGPPASIRFSCLVKIKTRDIFEALDPISTLSCKKFNEYVKKM